MYSRLPVLTENFGVVLEVKNFWFRMSAETLILGLKYFLDSLSSFSEVPA